MMQRQEGSTSSSSAWGRRLLSIVGWGAIVYLVFAALVAFVVPDFARNMLQQKLSVDPFVARIDHLRINPFKLSIEAEGFKLSEGQPADPEKGAARVLLDFEKLRLDISPWALSKRAIGFDEIALTKPQVGMEIDRQQLLNWQRYLDQLQASLAPESGAEPVAQDAGDDELPRLLVDKLLLEDVGLTFVDYNKPGPFRADFGPLTLEVLNLSTLIGDDASYTLSATTERSELLAWNGSLSLNPLRSAGSIAVSGWRLPMVWDYFKEQVQFEVASGTANISGQYNYDGNLVFSDGALGLDNIVVLDRSGDRPELVALPTTRLGGIVFDLDRQRLDIANVDLAGLKVQETIDPNGVSKLASVFSPASASQAGAPQPATNSAGTTGKEGAPPPGGGIPAEAGARTPKELDAQGGPVEGAEKIAPGESEGAAPATDTAPPPASKPVGEDEGKTPGEGAPRIEQTGLLTPEAARPAASASDALWPLRFSLVASANASTPAQPTVEPAAPEPAVANPAAAGQAKGSEGGVLPVAAGEQSPSPASAPATSVPSSPAGAERGTGFANHDGESEPVADDGPATGQPAKPTQPAVSSATAAKAVDDEPGSEFSVGIGRVALSDAAITVLHQISASIANEVLLQDIAVEVKGFEFPSGEIEAFSIDTRINEAGKLSLQGKGDIDPLQADFQLQLDGFELAALMPYVEPLLAIELESGALGAKLNGSLSQRDERLDSKVDGQVTFSQLLVNEAKKSTKILSWEALNLNQLAWESEPAALRIDQVELMQPFAKIVIFEDGSTNFGKLVIETGEAANDGAVESAKSPAGAEVEGAPSEQDVATSPVSVAIRSVDFHDGTADFADLSLNRTFRAAIYGIKGSIKGLDSDAAAAATVDLKGQVEKYAPVTLKGEVKPLSEKLMVDLDLRFRNLELTSVSPYSDTYAGYNIDKGKLDADFEYKIVDQKLSAENKLVIDQLTLGERTESATATSLPVALAVALLKDSNGVIDLNLPVSGDLDDPEFHYGALIGKALLNLVKKIVTAPFALLGSLVGAEAEDLDHVVFGPGESEAGEAQANKLNKVAEALAQRPQLTVSLRGIAVPALDIPVLKEQRLQAALAEQDIAYPISSGDRKKFFSWFEKTTGRDVGDLKKELKASQPDIGKEALEAQMQERLIDSLLRRQKVGADDLDNLARARSEQVRDLMVAAGVDPNRLFILDPSVSSEEKQQPSCKLELDAS